MTGGHRRATAIERPGRRVALAAACAAAALSACDDPEAADRLVSEGVARAQAGETADALERFEAALRLEPEHPAALVNGGLAALLQGRADVSRDLLTRYLAGHEAEILPRVYLARALVALDDREGALAALQHAVRLGFSDLASLTDGSFGPIQSDIRFVQLTALVAQRRGERAPTDDRGRLLLGDAPLRTLEARGLGPTCPSPFPPSNE